MSDNESAIRLNANQRRHYEVLFSRLEESLSRIESLTVDHEWPQVTLTITENDLTPAFRTTAPRQLDQLRREIVQLSSILGLQPRRVSRRRIISAILTAEAVRFEDSLASHMRGYGAVHSSVAQQLDPRLEDIARTLSAMASTLKTPNKSAT